MCVIVDNDHALFTFFLTEVFFLHRLSGIFKCMYTYGSKCKKSREA